MFHLDPALPLDPFVPDVPLLDPALPLNPALLILFILRCVPLDPALPIHFHQMFHLILRLHLILHFHLIHSAPVKPDDPALPLGSIYTQKYHLIQMFLSTRNSTLTLHLQMYQHFQTPESIKKEPSFHLQYQFYTNIYMQHY
jgi:hypothetical protein